MVAHRRAAQRRKMMATKPKHPKLVPYQRAVGKPQRMDTLLVRIVSEMVRAFGEAATSDSHHA
jgi:hypothetical protein